MKQLRAMHYLIIILLIMIGQNSSKSLLKNKTELNQEKDDQIFNYKLFKRFFLIRKCLKN